MVYSEDQTPLGIIDLQTCLQNVTNSSPEILSSLNTYDYAVYTTDYTEPGTPLVGHGMLSWLTLEKDDDPALDTINESIQNNSKLIVGRICTNILGLFSGGSKETLEVNLKLKPVTSCTQAQYLKSIKLYKELALFLPQNFDHPAWASFISQNSNLARFVQKDKCEFSTMSNTRQNQQQQDDIDDLVISRTSQRSNYINSRQKSISPSAYPSSDILFDDNFSKPSNIAFNFNSNFNRFMTSSSPPPMSSSIMSNLDSDAITSYSSPQHPPYDYTSTSLEKPSKSKWQDAPTSPTTMSSPSMLQNSNRPLKTAKRSLSITAPNTKRHIDSAEQMNFRVVARGSKYRPKDRIPKTFYESASLGTTTSDVSTILFCRNCGTVDPSTTWRRVKVTPNDGLGDEREHVLCNPCGLWFNAKRTMRPAHLWSKDANLSEIPGNSTMALSVSSPNDEMTPAPSLINGNTSNNSSASITNPTLPNSSTTPAPTTAIKPKEKSIRRRRGLGNKPHEDYVGPSIAELLAQNTRNKPSNYSANATLSSKSHVTPTVVTSSTPNTAVAYTKKQESSTSKDCNVTEHEKKSIKDNNDEDKTDKEETHEAVNQDNNLSSNVSTVNTPIDDCLERKKVVTSTVVSTKSKVNSGTKVTKKTKEKKLSKRAKKALLLQQTEPIFIAPAPPVVPVLPQETLKSHEDMGSKKSRLASPKSAPRLSAFNAINLDSSSTTVKKSGFTVMNKRSQPNNSMLKLSNDISDEKENISLKDNSSTEDVATGVASKDKLVMTMEQVHSLLATPQKSRQREIKSSDSHIHTVTVDDFGFFDPAAFSGSPSRWINKLFSPTKFSPGFGTDSHDDAFRDIMGSPSKIKGDMFEVLSHDFGLDTTVPTAFAKMMNHQTASIDNAENGTSNVSKRCRTSSPSPKSLNSSDQASDILIGESSSSSSEDHSSGPINRTVNKSINIASSPPIHVYSRDESSHTSDAPMEVWSDSPTTNNEDAGNEDIGTVKITSPELIKE